MTIFLRLPSFTGNDKPFLERLKQNAKRAGKEEKQEKGKHDKIGSSPQNV